MRITSFDDILLLLDKLDLFHMDFALHRMDFVLDALHLNRPLCPLVQIVGTNGKGSTSAFLASLAKEHGLRVGLYTSPHFVTFRERVRIDGCMLPADVWVSCVRTVYNTMPELTYFELLTLAGLLAFVEADVDIIILEAGLGGRYDATTAIAADLVCFTPISLDHEKVLGSTITAIATEKSYAMRFGKPVVTAVQVAGADCVLREMAYERGCPYHEVLPLTTYKLGLLGAHQQMNAALALSAFKLLCEMYAFEYKEDATIKALASAHIAGRLQVIRPEALHGSSYTTWPVPLLLDGAHNTDALQALITTIEELTVKPVAMIFSCLADKDLEHIVPCIQTLAKICGDIPIFVPTIMDNERAMLADELAALIGSRAMSCERMAVALREAMAFAEQYGEMERPVLVCGSLYLLAEFFILYPQCLDID